jgi:hypothetical protein
MKKLFLIMMVFCMFSGLKSVFLAYAGEKNSSQKHEKESGVPILYEQVLKDGQYAIDNFIDKHYRFSEGFGHRVELYILHKNVNGQMKSFIFLQ